MTAVDGALWIFRIGGAMFIDLPKSRPHAPAMTGREVLVSLARAGIVLAIGAVLAYVAISGLFTVVVWISGYS